MIPRLSTITQMPPKINKYITKQIFLQFFPQNKCPQLISFNDFEIKKKAKVCGFNYGQSFILAPTYCRKLSQICYA